MSTFCAPRRLLFCLAGMVATTCFGTMGCGLNPPIPKETVRRITTDGFPKGAISWLSNDEIVYAVQRNGSWDLELLDISAKRSRTIYDTLGDAQDPSCAPGGLQIVFVETLEGADQLSVLVRAQDWSVQPLLYYCGAQSPGFFASPSFSRDSGKVAVSSPWWLKDPGFLCVIPVGSYGCSLIFDGDGNGVNDSRWSHLSTRIAVSYSVDFGTQRIYTILENGAEGLAVTSGARDIDPDWSPNDDFLCFASDRGGVHDLWITKSDASGSLIQLTNDEYIESSPAWSPDGSWIAYASDTGSGDDLWMIRVPTLSQ